MFFSGQYFLPQHVDNMLWQGDGQKRPAQNPPGQNPPIDRIILWIESSLDTIPPEEMDIEILCDHLQYFLFPSHEISITFNIFTSIT